MHPHQKPIRKRSVDHIIAELQKAKDQIPFIRHIMFDDDAFFLMSLDEAVELVLFAFENGKSGDLFVNKAPAGTIGDLAQALKEIFKVNNSIKVIGTRHGEKLYETLCTREEMTKAEDMGDFYRIPADNRDLNYARYYSEGEKDNSKIMDYHSHNTQQFDVEAIKKLLNKLPLIKHELKAKH